MSQYTVMEEVVQLLFSGDKIYLFFTFEISLDLENISRTYFQLLEVSTIRIILRFSLLHLFLSFLAKTSVEKWFYIDTVK